MRPHKVVARATLIVALALVAVPGVVGSGAHPDLALDPDLFKPVEVASLVRGSVTTMAALDPRDKSDGALDRDEALMEPAAAPQAPDRPRVVQPRAEPGSVLKNPWRWDPEVSFYGPGFYGQRTACGYEYTADIVGVAHRWLPCGTRVQFRWAGKVVTVPVIDRGPYVSGRLWDLSGAACEALNHCWTGPIEWRYG